MSIQPSICFDLNSVLVITNSRIHWKLVFVHLKDPFIIMYFGLAVLFQKFRRHKKPPVSINFQKVNLTQKNKRFKLAIVAG